jgi:hypothetical protein
MIVKKSVFLVGIAFFIFGIFLISCGSIAMSIAGTESDPKYNDSNYLLIGRAMPKNYGDTGIYVYYAEKVQAFRQWLCISSGKIVQSLRIDWAWKQPDKMDMPDCKYNYSDMLFLFLIDSPERIMG